jgi:hypothetical protein
VRREGAVASAMGPQRQSGVAAFCRCSHRRGGYTGHGRCASTPRDCGPTLVPGNPIRLIHASARARTKGFGAPARDAGARLRADFHVAEPSAPAHRHSTFLSNPLRTVGFGSAGLLDTGGARNPQLTFGRGRS